MDHKNCMKVMPKNVKATEARKLSHAPDTSLLSREQIKFYQVHGYVIIRELFDIPTLNGYKKRFSDICNGRLASATVIKEYALVDKKTNPEDYIYKIQDILYDEVFKTYSENPKLLNIVSQLIGDDITAVNLMLINKPPGSTRHPAHQDLYYFPFRPVEKIVGVWTAVDPAYINNGCLYAVPGSHKSQRIYEHKIFPDSKKFFHTLVDEEKLAPTDNKVNLEMNPGDTLFFHPYLIHGSGPNLSESYRKCLAIHYANSNCHFIDLKGSVHESPAWQYEKEIKKRGIDLDYIEILKLKTKAVKGVKGSINL